MSTEKKTTEETETAVDSEAPVDTETSEAAGDTAVAVAEDHADDHDHDHEHEHHDDDEEEEFAFAVDPEFDIDYKGDCVYEVKVTVAAENEKAPAEKAYDELKSESALPGFRKGKAPIRLLEKKFGRAVRDDVLDKIVSATFRKLIKDKDLKPIAFPDIEGLDKARHRKEGEPIALTLKFEVSPRCELGKYRGIEIERPVVTVDQKDIDEAIEEMRGRLAVFETVDEAAAKEDQVIIDFSGTVDGEKFAGGSAENYPYVLGSGRFFQEFEAVLDGAKAGSSLTADVPFPADYSNAALAGKTAQFTIEVKEVKRRQLPDLDDDFAQQAGHETLAEMRETVGKELQEGSSSQSQRLAEEAALAKIVEGSTFEIPKSLIDSSANTYYEQEVRRLLSLRVPASELQAQDADIRKEAEANALSMIKSFVAVREIGEAEGIEVTEQDFEEAASDIMQRSGADHETVSRFLAMSEQRDSYEDRIFRRKALAVVMDNAKVTDKEVTREQLEKEDEAS